MATEYTRINTSLISRSQGIRRQMFEALRKEARPDSMKTTRRFFSKNDSPRRAGFIGSDPLMNIQDHYAGLFEEEKGKSAYIGLPHINEFGRDYGVSTPHFMRAKLEELRSRSVSGGTLRVLDLGCGDAIALVDLLMFAESLNIPLEAYGIDIRMPNAKIGNGMTIPDSVVKLRQHFIDDGRLRIYQGSIDNMLPNEDFPSEDWTGIMQLVVSTQVIRYVTDRVRTVEEIHRVLAYAGEAYLDFPTSGLISVDGQSEKRTLEFGKDAIPAAVAIGYQLAIQGRQGEFLRVGRGSEPPLVFGLHLEERRTNQAVNYFYVEGEVPSEERGLIPRYSNNANIAVQSREFDDD